MSHVTPTPGAAAAGATDPAELGVLEAARELRARRLSSAELTDAVLARIAARNGGAPTFDGAPDAVNAWARVYPGRGARDGPRRRRSPRARGRRARRSCAASRSGSRTSTPSPASP